MNSVPQSGLEFAHGRRREANLRRDVFGGADKKART